MERASVPYAEQAACLLDELATNSSNANAILAAGVESSLSKSLKLLFDEGIYCEHAIPSYSYDFILSRWIVRLSVV